MRYIYSGEAWRTDMSEVGQMLKHCAWHEVKKGLVTETQEKTELNVLQNLMEGGKMCASGEGAQMHSVQMKRWHSRATGGDW